MNLLAAVTNVRDRTVDGRLADLRRMPRDVVDSASNATLYRYLPLGDQPPSGLPVLLVPPLGAPDFRYDLRRGGSLVEHLLAAGRDVYLVDYGPISFAERGLGIELWVENVVPGAVHRVSEHRGGAPVQLVGWCLGGVLSLLTGSSEVRFETAPGGHLGVLTGRRSRDTTWADLDAFLDSHDPSR